MRLQKQFLISFSCILLIGCSGSSDSLDTNDANSSPTTNDGNTSSGNNDSADNNGGNSSGGTNGNTTPPTPAPTGPQPGDNSGVSDGHPRATYPDVNAPTNYDRNINSEPNSDTIVPVVAITEHPEAYISQTNGQFTIWAADNSNGSGLREIQCRLDQESFAPCQENVSRIQMTEGLHSFSARAIDYDDNISQEAEYLFYIDLTAPTVSIKKAPSASTSETQAQFTFEGADAGSGISHYECQLDGGSFQRCSQQETLNSLNNGAHTLNVRSVDNVGFKSPTASHQWVIDNQAPSITFTKQPKSQIYVNIDTPIVNISASDNLDGANVQLQCHFNNNPVNCLNNTDISFPNSSTGTYSFSVQATDQAGNSSSASIQWESVIISESRSTLISVGEDRPVDILFVVDNSGSMSFERSNLADRIDGMIEKIEGLDWQIAITSTDAKRNDHKSDGRLIELHGMSGQYILDASMDTNTAQTVFGNTVQNFGGGGGHEEAIYSSKRVIDRYLDGEVSHSQFLRDNADLSIVVLSDEDEASNGTKLRITPQGFIDYVQQSFNGKKNMVWHSIITRPGDTSCKNGEGFNYGNTYDELSRLTGFGELGGAIIGSVCEQDYTAQLADIGQSVKDLRNSLRLECAPFDQNGDGSPDVALMYKAEGQSNFSRYNGSYQIQGSLMSFSDILPPGDYKADYHCRIN